MLHQGPGLPMRLLQLLSQLISDDPALIAAVTHNLVLEVLEVSAHAAMVITRWDIPPL